VSLVYYFLGHSVDSENVKSVRKNNVELSSLTVADPKAGVAYWSLEFFSNSIFYAMQGLQAQKLAEIITFTTKQYCT